MVLFLNNKLLVLFLNYCILNHILFSRNYKKDRITFGGTLRCIFYPISYRYKFIILITYRVDIWKIQLGITNDQINAQELFQTKPMAAILFSESKGQERDVLSVSLPSPSPGSSKDNLSPKSRLFYSSQSPEVFQSPTRIIPSIPSTHFEESPRSYYSSNRSSRTPVSDLGNISSKRSRSQLNTIPYPTEAEFDFIFNRDDLQDYHSFGSGDKSSYEPGPSPRLSIGVIDSLEDRYMQRQLIREDRVRCRFSAVSKSMINNL